jgi:nucleotide-binding universal stress UspA family protein
MFKIIVPVDFSNPSIIAARYAIALAEQLNMAKVILLHCILPEATPGMEKKLKDILLQEAENELQHCIKELIPKNHSGLHLEYDVIFGDVPEKIIQKIEDEKSDLVVMGTTGSGGIKKIFIGSNTAQVVDKNLTCPTLVVPPETKISIPHKIVYTTDLKDSVSETPIVAAFAKIFNAQLEVVHITDDLHEPNDSATDQKSYEFVKQNNYSKIRYKSYIHPDVVEGIEKYIKENGADMVAMFSRRKTIFENWFDIGITREMSYHCDVPLLAIPYDMVLK